MKRIALFTTIALIAATAFAAEDAFLGYWFTEGDESIIELYQEDGKFYGKLVWIERPLDDEGNPTRDAENPEESLQSRPILGLNILNDFELMRNGKLEKGTIYNPNDGNTYSCVITPKSDTELHVRGFILGMRFLGQTQTWVAVPEEKASEMIAAQQAELSGE